MAPRQIDKCSLCKREYFLNNIEDLNGNSINTNNKDHKCPECQLLESQDILDLLKEWQKRFPSGKYLIPQHEMMIILNHAIGEIVELRLMLFNEMSARFNK